MPGKPSQFEVFADGELVCGKDEVGILARIVGGKGIPPEDRVIDLLRARSRGQSPSG